MIRVTNDGKIFALMQEGLVQGWKECTSVKEVALYSNKLTEAPTEQELPKWTGSKVSQQVVGNALALIKHYRSFQVMLSLYYNPDTGEWHAAVPKQQGSGAYVKYEDSESSHVPQGFYFSGTIHSHPNMGAFWSGTDRKDQVGKTGLHMVVGTNSNGDMTSHLCSLFLMGEQYDADQAFCFPDDVPEQPPAQWVTCIDNWRKEAEQQRARTQISYRPGTSFTWSSGQQVQPHMYGTGSWGGVYDDYQTWYGRSGSTSVYSQLEHASDDFVFNPDLDSSYRLSFTGLPPRALDIYVLRQMVKGLLIDKELRTKVMEQLGQAFQDLVSSGDNMRSELQAFPQDYMTLLANLAYIYIPDVSAQLQQAVLEYAGQWEENQQQDSTDEEGD